MKSIIAILPFRNDEYTKEFLIHDKNKCLIIEDKDNIINEIKKNYGYEINSEDLIDLGCVYDINEIKIKLYSIDLSYYEFKNDNTWIDIYECMALQDIYVHAILNKLSVVKRLRKTL